MHNFAIYGVGLLLHLVDRLHLHVGYQQFQQDDIDPLMVRHECQQTVDKAILRELPGQVIERPASPTYGARAAPRVMKYLIASA